MTGLLILMLLIKMILEEEEKGKISVFFMKSIVSVIVGGILYFIFTKLLLMRSNIDLSSYKGASEVSLIRIFTNMPNSISLCYQNFRSYFIAHKMYLTVPRGYQMLMKGIVCIIVFCTVYQFVMILRRNWKYALFFLLCISLIPVASSSITLLVPIGNSRLMDMSMIVFVVLLVVLIPTKGRVSFVAMRGYYVFLACFLWINILSVTNEQLALKEGQTASSGLARAVVSELIAEDCLEEDYAVAFVGRGPANDLFAKREAWGKVWGENHFGIGWGNSDNQFWDRLLIEYCGIDLNFCTSEQEATLRKKEDVAAMPIFPRNGSIAEIDGVIVVKISDEY